MWWHLYPIVLIFSRTYSTGTSDCKEPVQSECLNSTKIDHLECLMSAQTTNIKDLLKLFKETQQLIVDTRHEMNRHFDDNDSALDRLLDGRNSSFEKESTKPCSQSDALNGTNISVNPISMARQNGTIKSCRDLPYTDQALLQLPDSSPPFWVFCVQKHKDTGSGWLVIQQRVMGKVSFFRSWMEYREGFGVLDNDFWLGLENIHRITKFQHCELLVEMTDFLGISKFARYARFEIAGEDEEYAMRQLGSYSGTAGDSLRPHVGKRFSTYDNDNDHDDGRNCGLTFSSGWWFDKCFASGANLNGLPDKNDQATSIVWHGYGKTLISLKFTRMMLRVVN